MAELTEWPVPDSYVSDYLGLAAGHDAAAVAFATAAAVEFTQQYSPTLDRDDTTGEPLPVQRAAAVLGTVMLAARWYHRRNSPTGVVSFADFGAAQVRSSDPDVARLLRIDAYTPPRIG